ncbi:poly(hydroxyalkanoate) inclusion protein PhaP [Anoxybacillus vitaminiphilus]|uniref:Poly(Hydroxyalkanoate) inclusion protein PhaP n=1 Tax=Paranoxybacillus vitaminiphilus TaxID=581036 RepID=A0A327YSN2_9BACL|nr:hypothetical protein [Anoxybacillus vitaminiphilus]RAK23087.1 poly(hydroxyalkanoate) inclusion protein PhaP [Anoxybacillus vitaminiphilus]
MKENVTQVIDTVWDGWFKGVDLFFHSGKQVEQAVMEHLERQQQWIAQASENLGKARSEMKQQLEQFRKQTETELRNTLGDEASQTIAKWMTQLDEIAERFMQIALTPSKEFFNVSQAFYQQTANLFKQFFSQQQSNREEAEKFLKSYFEQIKESQKAFIEKAVDSPFFK